MKRISELTEIRGVVDYRRYADGNRMEERKTFEAGFKVHTIQGGARFGHYLIDYFIMVAIGLLINEYSLSQSNSFESSSITFSVYFDIGIYLIFIFYYFILESTIGRTIGKFATNSFVIDDFGKKPDAGTIFIRSLIRIIPFEAFSCLGDRGWHDRWTKTYVVNQQEWDRINKALSESGISYESEILDQ